jgi:C4-dicarboxylate-specific signal transduction histidine kinase
MERFKKLAGILNEVEIKCEIDADLELYCDAVEIEQVLVNLIGNGVDAVKDRSEKWVSIKSFKNQTDTIIQVIDSGPGIESDLANKIFQPFFTTKVVGEGTGLGLSVSKGILEEHGAKIVVNSAFPNTCFEISFPLQQANQKPKAA